MKKCKSCKYYYPILDWHGQCRRHAPIIVDHMTVYPKVTPTNWCGDFEEVEDGE